MRLLFDEQLLARVWELRAILSARDAVYVALAEAVRAVLITCDGPLARTSAVGARVELIAPRS